jgi:hypothetical protein
MILRLQIDLDHLDACRRNRPWFGLGRISRECSKAVPLVGFGQILEDTATLLAGSSYNDDEGVGGGVADCHDMKRAQWFGDGPVRRVMRTLNVLCTKWVSPHHMRVGHRALNLSYESYGFCLRAYIIHATQDYEKQPSDTGRKREDGLYFYFDVFDVFDVYHIISTQHGRR